MANRVLDSLAGTILSRSPKEDIRVGAAHYFSRTSKGYDRQQEFIINSALTDASTEVRMASTLALGKIKTDSSLTAIRRVLNDDKDYRVRVNAVRALRLFEFEKIQNDL
jgi:HEAT repeat protein